jgi:hypothetical protein
MALDGSVFTVADTPANDASFGRANNQYKKSGFPLLRVVALCELGTHAITNWIARSFARGEQPLAQRLLRFVPAGTLLLGDRNFHDFKLWEAAKKGGFDLLLRVKSSVKLPVLERLSDGSYLSEIHSRRKRKSTPPISVRVIVYQIQKSNGQWEECRLVTSLLEVSDGTAEELAELYSQRWEHELVLGEIKSSLAGRVTDLRAQSPLLVLQELDALLLGHYVVRAMILDAARKAGVPPIEISFKHALRVIADALPKLPKGASGYRSWYKKLIDEIAAIPRRKRRQRSYPRVRKVTRCAWPVKKPHHRQDKTAKKPKINSP